MKKKSIRKIMGITTATQDLELFHWPPKKSRRLKFRNFICGCRRSSDSTKDNLSRDSVRQVTFLLRHHTKDRVVLFMHPHPVDNRKTLYWEGTSMADIDLKGHVVLKETSIDKLIGARLREHELRGGEDASKNLRVWRDMHFSLKMPLPEYVITGKSTALRVTSHETVDWHCDLFTSTATLYDLSQAVSIMKNMRPLDAAKNQSDYCFSFYKSSSASLHVFNVDLPH